MNRLEQADHRAVIAHLKLRGIPGLVYWHTPNGAYYGGGWRQGAIMKSLGVRAGVSDLILFHDGRLYCLELKTVGGRPSLAQIEFCGDMERQGAFTAMPSGLDAAISTLESWGLLRKAS